MAKTGVTFAALLAVVAIAAFQAVQAQPEGRFTTATVRRGIGPQPNGTFAAAEMVKVPPGRALGMVTFRGDNSIATGVADTFIATGVGIKELIEIAYDVGGSRSRPFASIEGIPAWLERFDIDARTPRPIALGRGADGHEPPELRAMLQHLLVDRFQVVARWEPRQKVVYDLLRDGPLGPRLRSCADLPDVCQNAGYSQGTAPTPGQANFTHSHRMTGHPLSMFIGSLARDLQRPIIDGTGLDGPYRLDLQYPLPSRTIPIAGGLSFVRRPDTLSAVPPNDEWRAFSQALREQLGLRLEPRMAREEVLIIDRIALPSYDSP